jgi:probable phosphoglycerate mutase
MIGGWTDWELTSTGLEQAGAIARAIGREFTGRSVRLFTSDLLRARQTAEPIAASLHVKPEPCHALRESHLGSATGKPVTWLREHQAEQTTNVSVIDYRCLPDAE